jgi:hypothetical protein
MILVFSNFGEMLGIASNDEVCARRRSTFQEAIVWLILSFSQAA